MDVFNRRISPKVKVERKEPVNIEWRWIGRFIMDKPWWKAEYHRTNQEKSKPHSVTKAVADHLFFIWAHFSERDLLRLTGGEGAIRG